MTSAETNRLFVGLLLGVTAAAANVLGGSLIAHGRWSRRYLKYFIALGGGFHAGDGPAGNDSGIAEAAW
jgi:hypothetical protein